MTKEEAEEGLEKKRVVDRVKRASVLCPLIGDFCKTYCECWVDARIWPYHKLKELHCQDASYQDGHCSNPMLHREED